MTSFQTWRQSLFVHGCSQFGLGKWHFKYGLEEELHQSMQIEMLKYIFYFDKQKLCQKVFDSQSWNSFVVLKYGPLSYSLLRQVNVSNTNKCTADRIQAWFAWETGRIITKINQSPAVPAVSNFPKLKKKPKNPEEQNRTLVCSDKRLILCIVRSTECLRTNHHYSNLEKTR